MLYGHQEQVEPRKDDQYLFDLDHFTNLFDETMRCSESSGLPLSKEMEASWRHRCQASKVVLPPPHSIFSTRLQILCTGRPPYAALQPH